MRASVAFVGSCLSSNGKSKSQGRTESWKSLFPQNGNLSRVQHDSQFAAYVHQRLPFDGLEEVKNQHSKLVLPSQPPCHHEQKRSRPAIWRISNRICKSPSPPWQIGKSWSKSPAPFPDGVHAWGAILSSRLRVHSQSGRIFEHVQQCGSHAHIPRKAWDSGAKSQPLIAPWNGEFAERMSFEHKICLWWFLACILLHRISRCWPSIRPIIQSSNLIERTSVRRC